MSRRQSAERDPVAVARFGRILRFNMAVAVILWALVALSIVWLGLTWLVIALLVGLPVLVVYLAYLLRRFGTNATFS